MALDEVYLGPTIETDVTRVYLGTDIVFQRGAGGLDPDVQALLDRAVIDGYTPASGTVLTALNTFVLALKAGGVWTLSDALWLPATNGDSDFATYNLKDPTSHKLTKVNSPTFTSLQGFSGDKISSYLDSNTDLSTLANFQLNTSSLFRYSRTNIANNFDAELGVRSSVNSRVVLASGYGTKCIMRLNSNNDRFDSSNSLNTAAFYHANRSGPGTVNTGDLKLFYNGDEEPVANVGNPISTSVPSGYNMYALASNEQGTASFLSDRQISFFGVGGDLSSKAAELYTAIQTYMTTIGSAV